jgi:DNA (cytosine-5)-methyltransferase 1
MFCIGNGQANQSISDKVGALNCMHDQQAVAFERESMDSNKDYVVRRLTPLECERLQGFPDGWTDIPGASDTARYKALGNSIALPQWQIIIDNMAKYLPEKATLGSLFDGIGGFPLCWERTHGKGTAIWASEIEAFPIAVTTYRFGEETNND